MIADLRAALAFLTILPVGYPEGRKPGQAFAYFPLVGLLLGSLLWLCAAIPWPTPEVRAFVVLACWVVLTGGLHLDGFGDACDGLFATTTPARRLEIMQDPRTGSWAVVGLVVLLLGKWVLIKELPAAWLIGPPLAGRWALVLAAYGLPYARATGLGGYFREGLGEAQWAVAATLAVGLLVVAAGLIELRLLGLVLIPPLTVVLVGRWAAGRLGGGLTGDVYGTLCEVTELFSLAWLVIR
jgi:adenosylcobinamide-GDP ribazoletransferase